MENSPPNTAEGDFSLQHVRMHMLRMGMDTLELSDMLCVMPYPETITVTFPMGKLSAGFEMEGPLPYTYPTGETVKVTETRYSSLEMGKMNMIYEQGDNKWQMSAKNISQENSTITAIYTKIRVTIVDLHWDGDEVPAIESIPSWLLAAFGVKPGTCRPEAYAGCKFYSGEKADFSDGVMRDLHMEISKIKLTDTLLQVIFPEPPPEEEPVPDKLQPVNNYFAIGKGYTTIQYEVEKPGNVTLKIYTRFGRLVKTIVAEEKEKGKYSKTWEGRNEEGEPVAAGIYLVQLRAPGISVTKKICVVK